MAGRSLRRKKNRKIKCRSRYSGTYRNTLNNNNNNNKFDGG